jgi:hypothetical protein
MHNLQLHIDIMSDDDMMVLRAGSDRKQDRSFVQTHLQTFKSSHKHTVGPDSVSALHVACAMGPMKTAIALLDAGADPKRAASNGLTALDLAKQNKRWKLVKAIEQRTLNATGHP